MNIAVKIFTIYVFYLENDALRNYIFVRYLSTRLPSRVASDETKGNGEKNISAWCIGGTKTAMVAEKSSFVGGQAESSKSCLI